LAGSTVLVPLLAAMASAAAALLLAGGCGTGSGASPGPLVTRDRSIPAELARLAQIQRRPDATFRFVVSGDQHLGYDYFAKYLVPLIDRTDPDFAALIGDQTNSGADREYSALFGALAPVRCPVLDLPGNHEYLKGANRFANWFGFDHDYCFDHGQWRFVCLNDAPGVLTADQLAWLRATLSGSPGHSAIFMHVAPAGVEPQWDRCRYYQGRYWSTVFDDGAAEFREICAEYHVATVYAGHIHAFDARRDGETLYVITGGGGGLTGQFAADNPGNFCHLIVAEVSGAGLLNHTVYVPGYQYDAQNRVTRVGPDRSFVVDVARWETNAGQ